MKLTKNKGEWSELYAFLKLLSLGKLYAADENVNRNDSIYFPVLKILRDEERHGHLDFVISDQTGDVTILAEHNDPTIISKAWIDGAAARMYSEICAGSNRAFELDSAHEIMEKLKINRVAAPSSDKTDITMQVHDVYTGYDPICGFSIKSELGGAPTLLNASGATNFVFELEGISDQEAELINSINTKHKILDRIKEINAKGSMKFVSAKNKNFSANLMLIDTFMEDIIADILLDYYMNNGNDCGTLVRRLEDRNPLDYPRKGLYEYKFKKFLCSVALGMKPSELWDGNDEANGGYVIVKQDGDVVAYHLYNRNAFETYLLNNTKLERGSTTKHGFATIYEENSKKYINLNLQIRFI